MTMGRILRRTVQNDKRAGEHSSPLRVGNNLRVVPQNHIKIDGRAWKPAPTNGAPSRRPLRSHFFVRRERSVPVSEFTANPAAGASPRPTLILYFVRSKNTPTNPNLLICRKADYKYFILRRLLFEKQHFGDCRLTGRFAPIQSRTNLPVLQSTSIRRNK